MDLRIDIISLHKEGINKHPQQVMKYLGIDYKSSKPMMMVDCWDFYDCSNVPDKLPTYVEIKPPVLTTDNQ